jgi:hypothetical protein
MPDVAGWRLSSVMHYLQAIKYSRTDEPLKVAAKRREAGMILSSSRESRGGGGSYFTTPISRKYFSTPG